MPFKKNSPVEKVREIGVADAEPVDLFNLRGRARGAWQRLYDNSQLGDLARDLDIDQALHLSELVATALHKPVLLHADVKGEHIFVNTATGRLTGVIDWSDACIGHLSIDIYGLAISVGATAAARVACNAGYDGKVIVRGAFTARCDSIICLYAILHGDDDSPEWLLRLQL